MTEDFDILASRATKPFFYRAPTPPNKVPKEYQLAGVEYHVARDHAIFGDAPGLGKTAECIILGNAIGAQRTLVVCPASLRLNWQKEIWQWSTIPNVTTYPVLKSRDGISHEHHYVIVSYALLANPSILNAIMQQRWDHLILDEAHAIKDPKGNSRTKVICAPDLLPSVVGRITMATGTLLPNQPIECYNAIRLLNWDAIDRASVEDFRNYYYDKGDGFVRTKKLVHTSNGPVWKSSVSFSNQVRNVPRNLDDLQYRLRKNVMIRRLKEQVLHELPPKQWHPFPLAMTADIKRALKHPGWTKAEKLYEMDPGSFDGGVLIDGQIATARRELGEAKAPAVAEYINDLLESGVEKVVVGAYHLSVLSYLKDKLKIHGLVYMDGSTSTVRKQQAVDVFQADDRIRIILGQISPLGEGWTLTAAHDVVIAEPDWVPGKNDQLVDRTHRVGQRDHVIGHVPVVPGTLDERILGTAIAKDQNIYLSLDAH